MSELTEGLIRLPRVLKLVPVSKSSWWQGVKDQKYPQPVRISQRSVAWKARDIYAVIEHGIEWEKFSCASFEPLNHEIPGVPEIQKHR